MKYFLQSKATVTVLPLQCTIFFTDSVIKSIASKFETVFRILGQPFTELLCDAGELFAVFSLVKWKSH